MAELSREESSAMRSIGRETAARIARIAEDAARSAGMSRTFATVTKVNADGTVEVDFGDSSHPMSVGAIRMTTGCAGASVGDVVVVDTFAYVPLVTGIVSTGKNGVLPISHGGTGATTAAEAFKAITEGYTLDIQTNNTVDSWIPVFTNNSLIQHRVLPALPLPVASGGTGASDAAGARSNLGITGSFISGTAMTVPSRTSDCNSAPAGLSYYDPNTSNITPTASYGHLYTSDGIGWKFQIALTTGDGIWWRKNINNGGWTKWSQIADNPTSTSYYLMTPVYRLHNPYDKCYLFTSSTSEYNSLVSQGWTGEGIVFYAFHYA